MESFDLYLTSDASKIIEDSDNMSFSMGEDHNTMEYQGTLKIDVKNIAKKIEIM